MVEVRGRDAMKLLRRVLVNDVARIADGKVLYSSLCKADGGMVDDLTCYRHSATHFQLSPTPSRSTVWSRGSASTRPAWTPSSPTWAQASPISRCRGRRRATS